MCVYIYICTFTVRYSGGLWTGQHTSTQTSTQTSIQISKQSVGSPCLPSLKTWSSEEFLFLVVSCIHFPILFGISHLAHNFNLTRRHFARCLDHWPLAQGEKYCEPTDVDFTLSDEAELGWVPKRSVCEGWATRRFLSWDFLMCFFWIFET